MLEKYNLANEDYILTRYQTLLKKQGILTVRDLLYSFPVKYENYKVSSIHYRLALRLQEKPQRKAFRLILLCNQR